MHHGEDGAFILSQTGLIEKWVKASGMMDCKTIDTLASGTPLGMDTKSAQCDQVWNYPLVISMLIYLSSNSQLDTQYVVHQCTYFMYCLCIPYKKVMKCI